MQFEGLRYANLAAESFSTSIRWEGDVIKLEETVLTQHNSRFEQGSPFSFWVLILTAKKYETCVKGVKHV